MPKGDRPVTRLGHSVEVFRSAMANRWVSSQCCPLLGLSRAIRGLAIGNNWIAFFPATLAASDGSSFD